MDMDPSPCPELDLLMDELERWTALRDESLRASCASFAVTDAQRRWGDAIPLGVRQQERERQQKFERDAYRSLLKLAEISNMIIEARRRLKKSEVRNEPHS